VSGRILEFRPSCWPAVCRAVPQLEQNLVCGDDIAPQFGHFNWDGGSCVSILDPHLAQNFAFEGAVAPHDGQLTPVSEEVLWNNVFPHLGQNLACTGADVPHLTHVLVDIVINL